MKTNVVAIGLLSPSIGLTVWLIVSAFVGYAPTVTKTHVRTS